MEELSNKNILLSKKETQKGKVITTVTLLTLLLTNHLLANQDNSVIIEKILHNHRKA